MNDEYQHPAFPPPPYPDVVLWRYLDFWKFDWLVSNCRLFMPSAPFLGDQLEGTTPSGHDKWWDELAENAKSDEQRQIFKQNKKTQSNFAEMFRDEYYVSCWNMNAVESMRMWNEYTRTPESVAIKTSYQALRAALQKKVEIGMVRYINYSDHSNDRLPSLNMFEHITHKDREQFSFEHEVRAVAWSRTFYVPDIDPYFQDNHFEVEGQKGFLCFAPPVDIISLIHSVVLHPEVSSEFAKKIRSICEKKNLPNPIRSVFSN